jgi:hypothetical protein
MPTGGFVVYTGEIEMTRALLHKLNYAVGGRRVALTSALCLVAALSVAAEGNGALAFPTGTLAVLLLPIFEWQVQRSWRRSRHLAVEPWRYTVSDDAVSVTTPATSAVLT